jgi:hypothetical protein
MRGQRLVPQMLRHLGDFPRRLAQHCAAAYDFTPCPPVGYPELEGEVWCHRYYLRHLADEGRFPAWPLVEHVQLLQVRCRRILAPSLPSASVSPPSASGGRPAPALLGNRSVQCRLRAITAGAARGLAR